MKTIITSLRANNQVTVRYVSRPNSLCPRRGGDGSLQYSEKYVNKNIQRVEDVNSILAASCSERIHANIVESTQTSLFPSAHPLHNLVAPKNHIERIHANACDIPQQIEYCDTDGAFPMIVRSTYQELVAQKKNSLDIMKKSQQVSKKERPWGQVQTYKSFTRNAKQKILEAGAVVDKHIGKHGSYELTLTIPGSGAVVYDVVARWSGYIVNRMLQVIRRLEAKGYPIHWFFVWEHQKRGALHQHWCIAMKDEPMLVDYICRLLKSKWFELLKELSDKTGVDLFQRKGFNGTWRDTPEVWQSSINPVRKSVAAYFSKYMSKNIDTSKYNKARKAALEKRRGTPEAGVEGARVLSLCPSRYWGCSSSVRALTKLYSVDIVYEIGSARDAYDIYKLLMKAVESIADVVCSVARKFVKADEKTGFIYAKGWEKKLWFKPEALDIVTTVFKRLRASKLRKVDPIGALIWATEL